MSAPKRVRWVCPNDRHPGVLGPSRPRRDDVCRFCLPCSADRGRLVLRTAPALDRARLDREAAAEIRARVEAARRVARAAAYYEVAGLDSLAIFYEYQRLRSFQTRYLGQNHLPVLGYRLAVRRFEKEPRRHGVCARGDRVVRVNAFPGMTGPQLREILLHELAHAATPGRGHDVAWKTAFRSACEEALGFRPRVETRYIGETALALAGRAAGEAKPKEEASDG